MVYQRSSSSNQIAPQPAEDQSETTVQHEPKIELEAEGAVGGALVASDNEDEEAKGMIALLAEGIVTAVARAMLQIKK